MLQAIQVVGTRYRPVKLGNLRRGTGGKKLWKLVLAMTHGHCHHDVETSSNSVIDFDGDKLAAGQPRLVEKRTEIPNQNYTTRYATRRSVT